MKTSKSHMCTCESGMSGASWSADCILHGRSTGLQHGWIEPSDTPTSEHDSNPIREVPSHHVICPGCTHDFDAVPSSVKAVDAARAALNEEGNDGSTLD